MVNLTKCFKMKSVNTVDQAYSDTDAVTFDLALIDKGSGQSMEVELIAGVESTSKYIPHQIFKENEWISQAAPPHPKVNLLISTEESDYARFGYHFPTVVRGEISAIVDSGAQCCVWGYEDFLRAGFQKMDLLPVRQSLSAVSKVGLTILGACFLRLRGITHDSDPMSCAVFTYVSSDVSGFYLSQDAMIQLRIVSPGFPSVGAAGVMGVSEGRYTSDRECGCPKRTLPPRRPSHLPFSPVEENIDKMRDWVLEHYKSSTFNVCPHQILPEMCGPPIEIHVAPDATPSAVSVPTKVPLH